MGATSVGVNLLEREPSPIGCPLFTCLVGCLGGNTFVSLPLSCDSKISRNNCHPLVIKVEFCLSFDQRDPCVRTEVTVFRNISN